MSKICTTIEQSKKLIKLGVDVNTADMTYVSMKDYGENTYHLTVGKTDVNWAKDELGNLNWNDVYEKYIPAWSLSALLSILSTIIDYSYEFVFLKQTSDGRGNRLKNVYRCSVDIKDIWNIEPLDAVFEMVVWLKEMRRHE